MKKNKKAKITAQVIRNTKRTMKTRKREKERIIHTTELITTWGPGPSRCIEYNKDGKVINYNSYSKKMHQKDYLTKVAKDAIVENKAIKTSKKELINNILVSIGYSSKNHYTKSEKKKFTRIIKNKLFTKQKSVILTDEEIKKRFAEEKIKKAELLKLRIHISEVESAEQLLNSMTKTEKTGDHKFKYVIKRSKNENPIDDYDFETNYLHAKNKTDAVKKLHELIGYKYTKMDDFTGVSLIDLSDNVSWYYPKSGFTSKIAA